MVFFHFFTARAVLATCRNFPGTFAWGVMPCLKLEKSEGDAQFWVECLLNIPSRLLAEKHRGGKAAVVRARLVPFKKANTQKLFFFFFF